MRLVIQRVQEASVFIENNPTVSITSGMVVLLGIEESDTRDDVHWLTQKILQMRIFSDTEGKMNLDIREIKGSFLIVSQFTLHASTKKGNRPSFIRAARPDHAIPLYTYFIDHLRTNSECPVYTGIFGADMKVELVNDGPVTIIIDSKIRE